MKIYFKSKYLSERLDINLSKWKRWSRDFLAPDPLGGLQSGVARQFTLKDVFTVYLGGFLVGALKLSIPDAQCILKDLSPWLKAHGFFKVEVAIAQKFIQNIPTYYIYLYHTGHQHWCYVIKTLEASAMADDTGKVTETYSLSLIGTSSDPLSSGRAESAYAVAVSTLFINLLSKIG